MSDSEDAPPVLGEAEKDLDDCKDEAIDLDESEKDLRDRKDAAGLQIQTLRELNLRWKKNFHNLSTAISYGKKTQLPKDVLSELGDINRRANKAKHEGLGHPEAVNLLNSTGCGDGLEAGHLPSEQEGEMAARHSDVCELEKQFKQLRMDGNGTQQSIPAGLLTDAAVLDVLQKTSGAGMPVREIYLRALGKDPHTHQMGSGVAPQVKKQLYALQRKGRIVTTSPGLWALAPDRAHT